MSSNGCDDFIVTLWPFEEATWLKASALTEACREALCPLSLTRPSVEINSALEQPGTIHFQKWALEVLEAV